MCFSEFMSFILNVLALQTVILFLKYNKKVRDKNHLRAKSHRYGVKAFRVCFVLWFSKRLKGAERDGKRAGSKKA